MKKILKYTDSVVLRSSIYNTERLESFSIDTLRASLEDPFFIEALWLASPSLYQQAEKWKNNLLDEKQSQKVVYSLAKYYQRVSTRTTPFGLFAGNSVVPITDNEPTDPSHTGKFVRFSRIDMEFLCAVIEYIENNYDYRQLLYYRSNTSVYAISDCIRYVEYYYKDNRRVYTISEIQTNIYIEKIINSCKIQPHTFSEVVSLIDEPEIDLQEKIAFVNDLINNQVITSTLQPIISSADPMVQLIEELNKCNSNNKLTELIELLQSIKSALQTIDSHQNNPIESYKHIIKKIEKIGIPYNTSKLFQVDIAIQKESNTGLNKDDVDDILNALNSVSLLAANSSPLNSFINKFKDRYGETEVSLTTALDPDIGIGYPVEDIMRTDTPLVDDFKTNNRRYGNTGSTDMDKFLLGILISCTAEHKTSVDFKKEIAPFFRQKNDSIEKPGAFQPSIKIPVSKVLLDNKPHFLLGALGGNSALDLLCRFAHIDDNMQNIVNDIAKHEKGYYNENVVAEIIHLPESRVGNVISRPQVFEYQIPFCGDASVKSDKAIDIDDILISIDRRNRIRLKSKRLNKDIVPRLCNAHNFPLSPLPIYRFLCSVQNQAEIKNINFNWGSYSSFFKLVPRVSLNNFILYPLTFNLSSNDISTVISLIKRKASYTEIIKEVLAWRKALKIPEKVYLVESDNKLYVDFNNELSTLTFFDEIKNKTKFTLSEYFEFPKNSTGISFANEFMIPFLNTTKVPAQSEKITLSNPDEDSNDTLLPGSKVVYFKLYGGYKYLEKFLLSDIQPLLNSFIADGIIDKWFFIRFYDTDNHLRVRIFLKDLKYISYIFTQLESVIKEPINNKTIQKYTIDTYERELSRYKKITVAENFFYHDSIYICDTLNLIQETDDPEKYRWTTALLNIDNILDLAGLDIKQKAELLSQLRTAFFNEFGAGKELHKKLSTKYRDNNAWIETVLKQVDVQTVFLKQHSEVLLKRTNNIKQMISDLSDDLNKSDLMQVLHSYIHMTCNRLFISEPRKHELVIYDFLDRQYKSLISRTKNSKSNA